MGRGAAAAGRRDPMVGRRRGVGSVGSTGSAGRPRTALRQGATYIPRHPIDQMRNGPMAARRDDPDGRNGRTERCKSHDGAAPVADCPSEGKLTGRAMRRYPATRLEVGRPSPPRDSTASRATRPIPCPAGPPPQDRPVAAGSIEAARGRMKGRRRSNVIWNRRRFTFAAIVASWTLPASVDTIPGPRPGSLRRGTGAVSAPSPCRPRPGGGRRPMCALTPASPASVRAIEG